MKRAVRTGLLLLVTLALLLPTCAMATQSGSTGSIQATLAYNGRAISGARLSIYQVGERQTRNGFSTFVAISPFTSVVTTFEGVISQDTVNALAKVVTDQALTGTEVTTDASGGAKWSDLPYGVYLVRQTGATGMATRYSTIKPFLVFVPVMNSTGTGWITDIEAFPKTEPTPAPAPTPSPSPEPTSAFVTITVRKNWADASNADGIRPQAITLYLYRKLSTSDTYPTTPYMTVDRMTGTGNTWRFTFYDLPRRDDNGVEYNYLVRERDVNGYEVDYQNNNGTVITNVHNTPTPDPNNTPTPEPPITPEPSASPTPPPNVPTGVREIDGEWYYIDEYGTPLGLVPQTGDESDMLLYAGVALLMLSIACALLVVLKRRRQTQQ